MWQGLLMLLLATKLQVVFATNFEICVQSDADLANALDTARASAVTAKIVQHKLTVQNKAYDLNNTVWHASHRYGIQSGSELLGGYTANCAARNIAVGNTLVIDTSGSGFAGVLPKGDLTVEGLTFAVPGGINLDLGSDGGYFPIPAGTEIVFRRDAFVNASVGSLFVYWNQVANSSGSTIRVVDTLIANNSNLGIFCALELGAASGAPTFEVVNNTVVGNSGVSTGAGACLSNSGNAVFRVYNNIFYGTTGTTPADLATDTNQVVQYNNIWGVRSGTAAIQSQNNQPGTDPKLDASYRPIQVPQSPAINAGFNNPPGGLPSSDLDGGPRVVGSIVDIGAYESSIDPKPVQTVTQVVDDGSAGTLRAAIASVNSNGGGTIKFDIGTGCGPHVITINNAAGELPALVADATIDGYANTQAGASPNTLDVGDDAEICVILEAGGASPPARGLVVASNAADSVSVTIRGLGFSNFSTTAIDLQGGSGHLVTGNHFGGVVNGHTMLANGFDIRIANNSHNDTIGGTDAGERNIIGDATGSGIVIGAGSTGNIVLNNYIGIGWSTGSSSFTNRGNGARGIYVAGDTTFIAFNLIGNNGQAGIVLDSGGAHTSYIYGNRIGADGQGSVFSNAGAGIHLIGDSGGGGDAPNDNWIYTNTIASNGGQGILIDVGQRNWLVHNSIYANGGLGIDLGAPGPAFPQSDDGAILLADAANRTQNFPILTSAGGDIGLGRVAGSLTTTPGDYEIDLYIDGSCDSSGYGQGAVWIGAATVTVPVPSVGDQNTKQFSIAVQAPYLSPLFGGSAITATATDVLLNTSEFSPCATYSDNGIFFDGFEPTPI